MAKPSRRDVELEKYIDREDAIERYTYAAVVGNRQAMKEALAQVDAVPDCTCGMAQRPRGSHHYIGCELAEWVQARRDERRRRAEERRAGD